MSVCTVEGLTLEREVVLFYVIPEGKLRTGDGNAKN